MANDIININVSETIETVAITVNPNLTTVNINKATPVGVNAQDLQSVTDIGASTSNPITIDTLGVEEYGLNVTSYEGINVNSDIRGITVVSTGGTAIQAVGDSSGINTSGTDTGIQTTSIDGSAIIAISNTGTVGNFIAGNSANGIIIESGTSSIGIPFQVSKNSVTKASINQAGELTANKLIKSGGTSSQFLMADGSTSVATSGVTNLTTSQTSTNFTINSDTGTDASVPLGNGTLAGATLNDYTTTEKSKLNGIASGAEVNVNADWNATSGDAQILNKPTIPSISGLATTTYVDTQDALKQNNITLTTTGSSGAATLVGATLNIPQYSGGSTITNTSQLINDGDNGVSHFISLEDLPSNLTLYPTNVASDVSTYYKLVTSITDADYNTTAVNIPTGTITGTNQFISALVSSPNIIVGNPGIFNVTVIGNIQKLSGTGDAEFYFSIYKRTSSGTETLITTSGNTLPVVNSGYAEFSASALWNDGTFLATDRIVMKFYGTHIHGGSNPSFQFQFGGINPIRTLVPIPLTVVPVLKLDELLDVTAQTPTNNDLLTYETSTSLWKNKSIVTSLGYTPANVDSQTFTGTPTLPTGTIATTQTALDSSTKLATTAFVTTANNLKADKSMSAYSFRVNNTSATANQTETTYKSLGQQTYVGTPTWTATTVPSGTTTHTYNWIQIGNMVTLKITLLYSVAGLVVTSVIVPLPSDVPTPLKPSGFTAASNYLYVANGFALGIITAAPASGGRVWMRSNSANTGFEISASLPSGSHIAFDCTVQYFTS